jgi:hypothetical protein
MTSWASEAAAINATKQKAAEKRSISGPRMIASERIARLWGDWCAVASLSANVTAESFGALKFEIFFSRGTLAQVVSGSGLCSSELLFSWQVIKL